MKETDPLQSASLAIKFRAAAVAWTVPVMLTAAAMTVGVERHVALLSLFITVPLVFIIVITITRSELEVVSEPKSLAVEDIQRVLDSFTRSAVDEEIAARRYFLRATESATPDYRSFKRSSSVMLSSLVWQMVLVIYFAVAKILESSRTTTRSLLGLSHSEPPTFERLFYAEGAVRRLRAEWALRTWISASDAEELKVAKQTISRVIANDKARDAILRVETIAGQTIYFVIAKSEDLSLNVPQSDLEPDQAALFNAEKISERKVNGAA